MTVTRPIRVTSQEQTLENVLRWAGWVVERTRFAGGVCAAAIV